MQELSGIIAIIGWICVIVAIFKMITIGKHHVDRRSYGGRAMDSDLMKPYENALLIGALGGGLILLASYLG